MELILSMFTLLGAQTEILKYLLIYFKITMMDPYMLL